jgi:DNA-binding CsgD family transcriptional regulator
LEDVFVGRQAELARLAHVMELVEQGQPWLVTVEGDSGVGKTALVRHGLPASKCRPALWARADAAESDMDYGVVAQLLRDVESRVLRRYPLLGPGQPSSSFGVGAQLLGVVSDLQAEGPVVIVVDDVQWADSRSVEALSFVLRRLSVDSVLMLVLVRGDRDHLDEPVRRMLNSAERRLRLPLSGLRLEDVEPLAAALGAPKLGSDVIQRLYQSTGGHTLYLRTMLGEAEALERLGPEDVVVPASLAAAIGDQLATLPAEARSLLEMLAVLNSRMPLALIGQGAGVPSPSSAVEPAVRAGLVDWWPHDPTSPVELRHALQRDAIYGRLSAKRRRELHARAVTLVDERTSWLHRVASLDRPDEELAATVANRLAFVYGLLGVGRKVVELGRWARATGVLDAASQSRAQAVLAIGLWQAGNQGAAQAEFAHLDPDPRRVEPIDAQSLLFRGFFQLLGGELPQAVADLSAAVRLARNGAIFTVGVRTYFHCALAQYLAGEWDDALLCAEQGASAATIHPRRYELPMLHLSSACVLAGRGASAEADRRARLAEEAAGSLDYDQERVYAGMARALVCQASGDYAGMVSALGRWQEDSSLDDRTRDYGVLWKPLLVEGLVGSRRREEAAAALELFHEQGDRVRHLQPALAWLEGWLAEQRGAPGAAREIYQCGEETACKDSPVYFARLLLAHGSLLRRTGQRRAAVEHLRRANAIYTGLRAAPFMAMAEQELTACGLSQPPTERRSVLEMTSRESEVARLVAQRKSNNEIAAELFVTRHTVEYHLSNIYAKFGVNSRQQLRHVLAAREVPAPI